MAGVSLIEWAAPGPYRVAFSTRLGGVSGGPFESLCRGLRDLALKYNGRIVLVYPVHRNPNVRQVVDSVLSGIENVLLIDPLDYMPLVHLLKRTYMVLTDSGGLQEEAPSLWHGEGHRNRRCGHRRRGFPAVG